MEYARLFAVRIFPGLVVALLLVLLTPRSASAHAVAIRSDPPGACVPATTGSGCGDALTPSSTPGSAPSAIRVWFSEPSRPFGQGLTVVGPSGQRVDRGPVRVAGSAMSVDVDATQSGVYVVRWEVIGGDTHPGRGRFVFRVGPSVEGSSPNLDETATTDDIAPLGLALQTGSHWFHFIGYALSFGVVAFQVLILRSIPQSPIAVGRLRRLVTVGLVLLVVAEPLALLGQTASLGASQIVDPDTVSAALDSSFGRVLSLRLGAAFLLWVLVGIAKEGSGWGAPAILVVGGALAIVDGTSAHALSVRPPWLGLIVNAFHLMAAAGWIGGIGSVFSLWGLPTMKGDRRLLADRFGRFAVGMVATVVVAGGLMAWWHLAAPEGGVIAGFQTDYGRALAVKIIVAFAVFALAGWAIRRRDATTGAWRVVELVASVAVLGLAGLVVSLRPPS